MTNFTLIDSDILIDAGRGVTNAIDYLYNLEQQTTLAISTVTQMELLVGCRNKTEQHNTLQFLQNFHHFKLNEQISDQAITLLEQYRLSHNLLIADSLIAATAIYWNCPLISKNQKDYRYIPQLNLLPYP